MKPTLPKYPNIADVLDGSPEVDMSDCDMESKAAYYSKLSLIVFHNIHTALGSPGSFTTSAELTIAASNFAVANAIEQLASILDVGINVSVDNAGLENGLDNVCETLVELFVPQH